MPLRTPKEVPTTSIADIWAYVTRTMTDPDSYKADVSGIPAAVWAQAIRNITEQEFHQEYSSDEVQTTLNTTGSDQSLGSENITVALPTGMEIARVIALAVIMIANRTTNAQNIDLNFNVGGTEVFSEDDVIAFGAIEGSAVAPIAQEVTAIVTGSGTFALEAEAQISSANNVTFTVQYYLFVQYRKS